MENSYPVIADPPVFPAVNARASRPDGLVLGIVIAVSVGAPGIVAGVSAALDGLQAPLPAALTARTWK